MLKSQPCLQRVFFQMPIQVKDLEFLKRCVQLAQNGDARVFPNPRVGAVIVKNGHVCGEGWHVQAGKGHAEVNAIEQCGTMDLTGATAYVSLEPCGHFGRTPPCAQLLIEKGIRRVVYAVPDPGPGQGGAEILKKAGLEVECASSPAALKILEPFCKNLLLQQTYLIQKWAMTLDGKIALSNGDSQWITNTASRTQVHRTRTIVDGIMVGAGTVCKDQPRLDIRHNVEGPMPRPIIWDPKGKTCNMAEWWESQVPRKPLVLTQATALDWPKGIVVEQRWQAEDLCSVLFEHGCHSVLVEGGAGLHGWMLDHQLADAVQVYIAPKICGGSQSLSPLGGNGVETMAQAHKLDLMEWENLDGDLMLDGLLKKHHPQLELYAK